jgi:NitT/TauT family transport system substrate-binding protein
VIVAEPWVTRILKTGKGVVWQPATRVLPGLQFAILAFGPRLVESHRDAGQRFMRAYLRALHRYNEGKTRRNLEVLARHTKLDVALLRETWWPRMRDDGRVEVNSVLAFQQWAHDQGLVDRVLAVEDWYDASFAEAAAKTLKPAVKRRAGRDGPTPRRGSAE